MVKLGLPSWLAGKERRSDSAKTTASEESTSSEESTASFKSTSSEESAISKERRLDSVETTALIVEFVEWTASEERVVSKESATSFKSTSSEESAISKERRSDSAETTALIVEWTASEERVASEESATSEERSGSTAWLSARKFKWSSPTSLKKSNNGHRKSENELPVFLRKDPISYVCAEEENDPFQLLLIQPPSDNPRDIQFKLNQHRVARNVAHVLNLSLIDAEKLTKQALQEGSAVLGTWTMLECFDFEKKLGQLGIMCRSIPAPFFSVLAAEEASLLSKEEQDDPAFDLSKEATSQFAKEEEEESFLVLADLVDEEYFFSPSTHRSSSYASVGTDAKPEFKTQVSRKLHRGHSDSCVSIGTYARAEFSAPEFQKHTSWKPHHMCDGAIAG